ncbi:MAG: hypothetical protein IJV13_03640 [Prevotella sp.]|nr:hypothetical protein [Prevotella sp.]
MKKILFLTASAIAMLASCSQNDLEAPVVAEAQQSAVEFGTYLGKAATSRAGWTGDISETGAELKNDTKANGFGVFATYTKNLDYDAATATKLPNFMYNQQVTWASTAWTYSPLKYWPNGLDDLQPADGGDDATLTEGGKVSFFAYAPYVTKAAADDDASTGTGIIGMSANNADAHPTVTYKMNTTGKNVDLLWGTASTTASEQSGDNLSGAKQAGATLTGGQAPVNVNITKQQKDGKVRFLFKHALAKVGGAGDGLQIKLDADEGTGFGSTSNTTVVTVTNIQISKNSSATKQASGTLDLATGVWSSLDGSDAFSQTIKTGASGDSEAELNAAIKEQAVNTTVDAVANSTWSDAENGMLYNSHTGVTLSAQNVYNDNVAPLLFFPGETPSLDVQITYTIRTKDPNLASGYSEVVQTVKKTVTFGSTVVMNKRYKLLIILGITSVKFEATVDNWEDVDATGNQIINLPLNVN